MIFKSTARLFQKKVSGLIEGKTHTHSEYKVTVMGQTTHDEGRMDFDACVGLEENTKQLCKLKQSIGQLKGTDSGN